MIRVTRLDGTGVLVNVDQITAAHRKVGRMTKDIAAELGKKR